MILIPDQDCQVCCFADLDCNGDVGIGDLLILLAAWGPCVGCPADLDCDGDVDVEDLLLLLGAWDVCGTATSGPPQNVLDCLDKFCCAEEDMLALEMCLCVVDPECEITQ